MKFINVILEETDEDIALDARKEEFLLAIYELIYDNTYERYDNHFLDEPGHEYTGVFRRIRISPNKKLVKDHFLLQIEVDSELKNYNVDDFHAHTTETLKCPRDLFVLYVKTFRMLIHNKAKHLLEEYADILDQVKIRFEQSYLMIEHTLFNLTKFYDEEVLNNGPFKIFSFKRFMYDDITPDITLPHSVKASAGYLIEQNRMIKKSKQLSKIYQSGTFKNIKYHFELVKMDSYLPAESVDLINGIIIHNTKAPQRYKISFLGLKVDDPVMRDQEIVPYFKRKSKDNPGGETNEITQYEEELIHWIKKNFKAYGIEAR